MSIFSLWEEEADRTGNRILHRKAEETGFILPGEEIIRKDITVIL